MKSVAAVTGALWLTAGCAVSNLDLVNDHRLHFTVPANRAHLHLPVQLRWTMTGLPAGGGGSTSWGSFAVFVDRPPVRPGQTLAAVASGDRSCRPASGCPDAAYLAGHQVYTTSAGSILLTRIDNLSNDRQSEQLHEVTVILLDPSGHRIGESAWYRDFWLPRAGLG